jgi:hypothetical protein
MGQIDPWRAFLFGLGNGREAPKRSARERSFIAGVPSGGAATPLQTLRPSDRERDLNEGTI